MAAKNEDRPIIIKRKKVVAGGGHHGGAWKVAYADFVTAMMAFFLLMWLLNATTEDQRKGLADYFTPKIPISRTSAGGSGMLAGVTIFSSEKVAETGVAGVGDAEKRRDLGQDDEQRGAGGDAATVDQAIAPPTDAGNAETAPDDEAETDPAQERASGLDPEATAKALAEQAERDRLEEIGRKIAEAMSRAEDGALEQHFVLHMSPEGLVIEIIDAAEQALFASASAKPVPILELLMDVLVPVLEQTTNGIAVVGHTDAVPFGGDRYSNWELSADRANAARRMLARRGLAEERVVRVTGKAAVEPLVPDPNAPQNRRISITLLRDSAR